MSAQPAELLPAAVKRSVAATLAVGMDVVVQRKNSATSERATTNYKGHIEAVFWTGLERTSFIVRVPREHTPSRYESTLAFVVVDELPDDWSQKILRILG